MQVSKKLKYMDMSDEVDMSKVTSKSECPHRLYEASRVDHLQRDLKRALETFDMDTSLMQRKLFGHTYIVSNSEHPL